ncbi:hypothetical protein Pcinc_010057 [Petrolisthes cinctipes]|uniref:Uncharacterized protein n=1 Tax=Petrolisthes cinctipes TaxID=88211 RepID=A0AAE1KXS8_PETCI|nr:hypothetical protein Pcinc_010057 [Petrolisthes cinctipes]
MESEGSKAREEKTELQESKFGEICNTNSESPLTVLTPVIFRLRILICNPYDAFYPVLADLSLRHMTFAGVAKVVLCWLVVAGTDDTTTTFLPSFLPSFHPSFHHHHLPPPPPSPSTTTMHLHLLPPSPPPPPSPFTTSTSFPLHFHHLLPPSLPPPPSPFTSTTFTFPSTAPRSSLACAFTSQEHKAVP